MFKLLNLWTEGRRPRRIQLNVKLNRKQPMLRVGFFFFIVLISFFLLLILMRFLMFYSMCIFMLCQGDRKKRIISVMHATIELEVPLSLPAIHFFNLLIYLLLFIYIYVCVCGKVCSSYRLLFGGEQFYFVFLMKNWFIKRNYWKLKWNIPFNAFDKSLNYLQGCFVVYFYVFYAFLSFFNFIKINIILHYAVKVKETFDWHTQCALILWFCIFLQTSPIHPPAPTFATFLKCKKK